MLKQRVVMMGSATLLAGALLATGCGGGSSDSATTPMENVAISSPSAGAAVDSTFTAAVNLDAFTVNGDAVGMAPKAGEGHLHFALDGGKYDLPKHSGANGELAEKLGVAGKYSPSVTPSITYTDIPPGPHTLKVFLANNDHSDTGSSATVDFTVKGGPAVSFVNPAPDAAVGSTFSAKVDLKDFALDGAAVGKAAKAGQGHLHFTLDGGKYDLPKYSGANGELAQKLGVAGKYSPSVTPSITYTGIPAGAHTLEVALANNDHSDTGVRASVDFTTK